VAARDPGGIAVTLTRPQLAVLQLLEDRVLPVETTRQQTGNERVNIRAASTLAGLGLVKLRPISPLRTYRARMLPAGVEALRRWRDEQRQRSIAPARYPAKQVERPKLRPVGAPCRHGCGKLAKPHARWPHLCADYCSEKCKVNEGAQRNRLQQRVVAEAIRTKLGLRTGRGPTFTLPELEAIDRRLRQVLPYGGKAMSPARRRRAS
jgi:hypothetical protein